MLQCRESLDDTMRMRTRYLPAEAVAGRTVGGSAAAAQLLAVKVTEGRSMEAGSKIMHVSDSVAGLVVRSGSRGFGVAGSFSQCAFAWIVW